MNIAILDFETTGVDSAICRPIEVAMAIVDEEFNVLTDIYQSLMYHRSYPQIGEDIEALTGIVKEDVYENGKDPEIVLRNIDTLVNDYNVGYMMAYNSEYDSTVYSEELKRCDLFGKPEGKPGHMAWLCAMKDVRTNYKYKCWKLSHLALDYGVAIDPKKLHRASADVLLTIDMLKAAKTNVPEIVEYYGTPWVALEAVTREPWKDGGVSTGKAKEKGFRWETPLGHNKKFTKKWVTMKKEFEVIPFINSCPELTIRRVP